MPEEQQVEEEEDEDEDMDEEYTPEMARELMKRGLILSMYIPLKYLVVLAAVGNMIHLLSTQHATLPVWFQGLLNKSSNMCACLPSLTDLTKKKPAVTFSHRITVSLGLSLPIIS